MKLLIALCFVVSAFPAFSRAPEHAFAEAVVCGNGSNAPLAKPSLIPNDEYYENQSVALAHIKGLNKAWEATEGEGTTIAIIDTGLDYNHPDFFDEHGNSKVRLDDARYYAHGYVVDSSYGYDLLDSRFSSIYFTTKETYLIEGKSWQGKDLILPGSSKDADIHGTNVAGVAAASTGNYGIVGIAPKAKILPIRIDMYMDSVAYALSYIYLLNTDSDQNNNVDVVNISIQSTSSWGAIETQAAKLKEIGTIIVASSGNSGTDSICYPAAYQSIIGVGALKEDSDTELADYSNFNKATSTSTSTTNNVDIVAPGTAYTTTANNSFKKISGTSFASPIAAGAAALWKSQNKNGTYNEFLTALHSNAIDLGDEGWDRYFGFGALSLEGLIDVSNIASPTSVTIEAEKTTLFVNKTTQLIANVLPEDESKGVDFSSNNPDIATVTRGGLVKGISAGVATITATSKVDNTVFDSIEITVDDSYIGVDRIEITNLNLDDYNYFDVGTVTQLDFQIYPENATNKEYTIEFESAVYDSYAEVESFKLSDDWKFTSLDCDELYLTITSVDNPNISAFYGIVINFPENEEIVHFITARYTGDTVYVGDVFDYSKIEVTGYFCDINHNETPRALTGWTHSELDVSSAGQKQLEIKYSEGVIERTTTILITVEERTPTLLSIRAVYEGPELYVGDFLDFDNLKVYATYDIIEETQVYNFTCTSLNTSVAGEKTVTITYNGKTCTVVINVLERPTPSPEEDTSQDELKTVNGCVGNMISSSILILLLTSASTLLLFKKKKRD